MTREDMKVNTVELAKDGEPQYMRILKMRGDRKGCDRSRRENDVTHVKDNVREDDATHEDSVGEDGRGKDTREAVILRIKHPGKHHNR